MAAGHTVALVGFSSAESTTIESFFRLAARRPPGYLVQDEVLDAQVLIVNADNVQAVVLVRDAELPGRVLLLGSSDSGTGWPLQQKPVKLVALLAALDKLVGARAHTAAALQRSRSDAESDGRPSMLQGLDASMKLASGRVAPQRHAPQLAPGDGADRSFAHTQPFDAAMLPALPQRPARRAAADTEFPPTRPMRDSDALNNQPESRALPSATRAATRAAAPAPAFAPAPPLARVSVRRPGVVRMTEIGIEDDMPSPSAARQTATGKSKATTDAAPEVPRGDMLLVAESLLEGRILLKRFKRYGLSVDWSREATQALVMLKAHPYRVVVIDRLNGSPDANQVCRVAKQTKGPKGAPVVIMFAPTAGSMDRMKAGLAGSDAYLSRSVGEADLYKVLAQHRLVSLNGFAPTNVGF